MDVLRGTLHAASRTIDASVAAAGAIGGAAVNGVVGGFQGVVGGVQSGLSTGSRSIPAAALTVAAVGAVGLVEWPLLLPVGGTLLGVHYLTHRSDGGSTRRVASRSGAKGRSGSRPSRRPRTAARSRPGRSAQH
ncbi:hypothetical protein [Mycobacterium sp. E796]|uniref:hypothetical protein n=1 Tax=Mycobacterium sp. E796 TaxID=1834151 RepID=UPI0009EE4015|nr:hypothetical protein [Mycobacterium sp. E796]